MLRAMPFVVSVTETLVNSTVIGGLHDGLKVAITDRLNSAKPFRTWNDPVLLTDSLLTACGWWPPPLMQRAVALRVSVTVSSSPSPASLPLTVSVSPDRVAV